MHYIHVFRVIVLVFGSFRKSLDSCTASEDVTMRVQSFSFTKPSIIGQRSSAMCATNKAEDQMQFRWLKDGQEIKKSGRINLMHLAEISTIIIDPLTETDSGNYTCIVTARSASDSFSAELNVLVPPYWKRKPSDVEVVRGESVNIDCMAHGKPTPSHEWMKVNDNKLYEIATTPNGIEVHKNGTLVIDTAEKKYEGFYRCRVNNDVGNALVQTISVKIIVPARFEEKFMMVTVRRGETANLKCEAQGDKPLTITWTKDKAEIDFKKYTRLEKFDRDIENGLSSELIVRTTDRSDGALYACHAKNEFGSDDKSIKLLVVEVPAPPLDVKIKEVWSRTASITWSTPYAGNSPITKYYIQYWRDRGGPHRLLEETVPHTLTTVLLKNLLPGTPYAVTVLGENEVGQGQPSEILKFVTGEEEPNGPPTDVWVEAKSSSTILVTWKPPPREHWNGELRGYFVGYKVDVSSHPYSFKTVDTAANDSQEYLLTNLMKSTKYNIVVKAYNSAGTGPPSQDLIAKTLDGDVPDPPSFTVVAASESKITLRWGDPPSRNIPVTGYTLHYRKDGGEWLHIPIIASTSKNRFTITNLDSSTEYKIYITASNQYGNGDPSDITTVKTSIKGFVIGNTETYVDLSIIVPVAACVLAFIVVAIVVIIYYRKSKARNNLERALQGGKPFPYTGSTQRYIDIDKTRQPHDPGTPASTVASYATIPAHEILSEERAQELKAFLHANMKDRPLPSKPNSLKKKHKSHVYDTAQ